MADFLISDGLLSGSDGVEGIVFSKKWGKPGPSGAFAASAKKIKKGDRVWVYVQKERVLVSVMTVIATSADFSEKAHSFSPSGILGQAIHLSDPLEIKELMAWDSNPGFWPGYKIFTSTGRTKVSPVCVGPLSAKTVVMLQERL